MIDDLLPKALPLIAAMLYAVGAMLAKRAAELGVGAWRSVFVANMMVAVIFQPLWLLGGHFHAELWWQPALVGLCFFGGQWFTYYCLERGEVSVATPVMGIKLLLVAVFLTFVAGQQLRWQLWLASALATLGIVLLNRSQPKNHQHLAFTIITAMAAAACFALFDVLVQKWSPSWGLGYFLPCSLLINAVFSTGFIFKFSAPLSAIPKPAWRWLLAGTAAIGTQSLIFVCTIAHWGQAAQSNVIYSSRGLWSVLLVWLLGHWVHSKEQSHGHEVMAWRLAGAALMTSAIVLTLIH
jgi:drug/metabolite transporter (DMT)-like permease